MVFVVHAPIQPPAEAVQLGGATDLPVVPARILFWITDSGEVPWGLDPVSRAVDSDRTHLTVLCVRTHGTPTIQSESGTAPRRSLAGSVPAHADPPIEHRHTCTIRAERPMKGQGRR